MDLSPEDFSSFHQAIHGVPPFEWQSRLLRRVVADRGWPSILDLPTGAGKTTCIDIALFALALDTIDGTTSWCPRRIAMVIDRRIVVDQVAERGRKLLNALLTDKDPVVQEVSTRLSTLTRNSSEPVGVFTLRGGMPKDDGWARSPEQALILASTVDQFGSRLLIQGYGVSDSMKSVHAGLVGNDVLLLLDEVHLSQPFAETLDALGRLRKKFGVTSGIDPRFHHAFLSATPGTSKVETFRLSADEMAPGSTLWLRLHAQKPTRLIEAADRTALEKACAQEARSLVASHDVIAVIVNRVASASKIAESLRKEAPLDAVAVLLTGRMRPLDRDDVLRELRPRVATGRDRSAVSRKLIVVGTQSLEAGADFDFDALVTEAASLDALRQRFGRVDRLGTYGRAGGVIVRDKRIKVDPVYGDAMVNTVTWLKGQHAPKAKTIDFGVMALPVSTEEELSNLIAPKLHAPVLLPAYLDSWIQTSPKPAVSPDVTLWLHGPKSGPPDVQVVWRADITDANPPTAREAIAIVSAIRPSSLEAISLPFVAARRWLSGQTDIDMSDVEGELQEIPEQPVDVHSWALRWNGSDSEIIGADQLRPGDTIVVPSSRGGISNHCFDPDSRHPVPDLAERAALIGRGVPMLRLHPTVLSGLGLRAASDLESGVSALSTLAAESDLTAWKQVWVDGLLAKRPMSIVVSGSDDWVVLQGRRVSRASIRTLLAAEPSAENGIDATTDPETSSHLGQPVTLQSHSATVERLARTFASASGLPGPLVNDIAFTGWLHDVGKADRRFQILLRGGSEIDFYKDETALAKSGMPRGAKAAHILAQQRSGYPRNGRHELLSVAMLEAHPELLARAQDADLVLHLLASHHGYCRPFAPAVGDDNAVEVTLKGHVSAVFGHVDFPRTSSLHGLERLDRPVADRFWGSARKYGWLELCWMEAILRLADHRASELEEASGEVT